MSKTYSITVRQNNDIVLIIKPRNDISIRFIFAFNGISQTYMGWMVDCFFDSLKSFMVDFPNFMKDSSDIISSQDFEKWLKDNGFRQVELNNTELLMEVYYQDRKP